VAIMSLSFLISAMWSRTSSALTERSPRNSAWVALMFLFELSFGTRRS
jgi:hypothetical protein